ncbi:FeoA family protein [Clostridium ganghwense]|uniref:Ferrous iron transport protein A n=1 Tax=Clostridium ganghwense TaxID=312089 RepID=A0ABT4CRR8_9CLOT|nr:ferrous iron transport protein A [Clostridium ganghwense]MCY6370916.1 ferrous iron transport protein A [Clostridium ganghwense]
MSISDLRPGEEGFIDRIIGNEKLSKRLLALGCIEGTKVSVKTSAPFGDPIIIKVRGFDLAIRKKDAQNIKIKTNLQMKTA